MATDKRPVLAVDVGGTKILAAIVSDDYQILARDYQLTMAEKGTEVVIQRLFSAIDQVLEKANLSLRQMSSISLAAAGAIDLEKGVITCSPNVGWRDLPLKKIVEEHYGIKTHLTNDAKAAALCEHELGAGRGTRDIIYITVSTGIGGGIIIDKKLYTGARGGAGEVGHMSIEADGPECKCGNKGCWEVLASGTALEEEARRRIRQGEESELTATVKGKLENITACEIEAAARKGDGVAREAIDKIAFYLGVGMVNLVNIFNPEMIVVGGGLSNMGELLLGPARQVVQERAFKLAADAVKIVRAKYGDEAGVLGAAILARNRGV